MTRKRSWAIEILERRLMLTSISSGQTIVGDIAARGQQDDYTFTASANDWFDLKLSDANSTSAFRPEVAVYGPTGTLVAQGSTQPTSTSVSVYYAVPQTGGGTYTVVVQNEGIGKSQTGAYDLQLTGDLLLTLATLSDNVYSGAGGAGGFTPIGGLNTDTQDAGYAAAAFLSPDKSQVIIAFRGTVSTGGTAELEDLDADASFLTSVATPSLSAIVSDAANFVATIHSEFKAATITLTGHSLGGAVAQLIGQEAQLSVESFNAPGAEPLYGQLSRDLSLVDDLGSSDSSVNYRLYGDQASLAGTQFANTKTISVADPNGTTFIRLANPLLDLAANANTFENLHSIVTVIQQIMANAQLMPSNAREPNDVLPVEEAIEALELAFGEIPANNSGLVSGRNVDTFFENDLDVFL